MIMWGNEGNNFKSNVVIDIPSSSQVHNHELIKLPERSATKEKKYMDRSHDNNKF